MLLSVIATGSTGNCYALHDGGKILLLDAGIPAPKIMRGIDHRAGDIVGCLITHEHQDHCKGAQKLNDLGIVCYGNHGTRKELPYLHGLNTPISLEPFAVRPFRVAHDAVDPCGWLILNRRTGERMVYATDACGLYNTFPGINYWLIECNYMDELLTPDMPGVVLDRLSHSHMSLARLCDVFRANDLTACKQIVLCHGSRERLNPSKAVETVKRLTGKPVEVAAAGMMIRLEMEPF